MTDSTRTIQDHTDDLRRASKTLADRIDAVTRRPFFDRLRREGVISIEGLEREKRSRLAEPGPESEQEAETVDAVQRTMEEMNASVCLPIVGQDALHGDGSYNNVRLRKIDLAAGFAVTTFGAISTADGFAGEYGPVGAAAWDSPEQMFFANNKLYIADQHNSCIRVVQ